MRDPERIERIGRLLVQIWLSDPDMRLGQIMANAVMMAGGGAPDLYFVEDEEVEAGLRQLLVRLDQVRSGAVV